MGVDRLTESLAGLSLAAAGTGRGTPPAAARAAAGSQRRVPELDFFSRQLEGDSKGADGGSWRRGAPHGMAGQAGALPDVHASVHAYLLAMMAHTALEFQAAAAAALASADGPRPERRQQWWRFERRPDGKWAALPTRGQHLDFSDDGEPWVKHLVHVRATDSFHVAKLAFQDEETKEDVMELVPAVAAKGAAEVRSLGYVGSFLLQHSSAEDLRYGLTAGSLCDAAQRCLALAADPRKQLSAGGGEDTLRGGPVGLRTDAVPVNPGQRAAVTGLRGGLSIIHGPPGTGKSTTIFHIVDARVQPGAQVLVTCSRNQAVDAVVGKLARVEGSLLVFGRKGRLGDTAKKFTLQARLAEHPDIKCWLECSRKLQALQKQLQAGSLRSREAAADVEACLAAALPPPDHGSKDWRGARAYHLSALRELRQLAQQEGRLDPQLLQPAINCLMGNVLPAVRVHAQRQILAETRVYACTIDSTPGMMHTLRSFEVKVDIDTVVVDEAGCVAEMAVPTLICLGPANLVLVGDHLQLPAYTDLVDPPRNHTRSLMQRAVDVGVPAAMLTEQYRMHPDICAAVSDEFYGGRLRTAADMRRRDSLARPCRFVDVDGRERWIDGGGYVNEQEAERAIQVAWDAHDELRGLGIARPRIFVVSLYNRQRDLLDKMLAAAGLKAAADCQVLSVDACQGDEADAVILSTVRIVYSGGSSKARFLSRFFKDPRRVNVAMSRARHLCVVVGCRHTLQAYQAGPWRNVLAHYPVVA